VSACGRFRPTPPAFRLMRNSGTAPLVNCSMSWSRFCDCPVSLTQRMPRAFSSASISVSMLVNCENSSTRRPSASISGRISISCSSLADCLTACADSSLSSCGSQQTWRSLSSASRMVMCDFARPLLSSASRTAFSVVRRMASYRSACLPSSSTRMMVSTLGGSSCATSALVRRSMKGAMRLRSCARRSGSPCFSIGVRKRSLNLAWLPRKPGIRKWNRLQISPRWFSIGVPLSARRWRVSSSPTTRAAWVLAFLMFCASSSTTRCQGACSQPSRSRCSSE
jgi:hypothetical protein